MNQDNNAVGGLSIGGASTGVVSTGDDSGAAVPDSLVREFPLLATLKAQGNPERPPLWFMRQAGRSLPEYRELRKKHSMLDLIRNPELAAEVTLQPVRRWGVDGAIIFADILNPLICLGMELEFLEGAGPVFRNPIRDDQRIRDLPMAAPEEAVSYTLEALRIVRRELQGSGVTLLGFAGAPFTVSYYLVEGKAPKTPLHLLHLMVERPAAWHDLQMKLVSYTADYLVAQVNAGAQAVQIFDSWVGILEPHRYQSQVAPYVKLLISEVKARTGVPVLYLALNSAAFTDQVVGVGADGLSIDWRQSLRAVAAAAHDQSMVLQGNLNPSLLCCRWSDISGEVDRVFEDGAALRGRWVFNLGHGILPETNLDTLAALVERVQAHRY